jgi:hypothetical protein
MAYNYTTQRSYIFTEQGQVDFLKIRDAAKKMLKECGAFREMELLSKAGGGDSWDHMACIDRLVELGEIQRLPRECWRQYSVYTTNKVHNL